MSIKKCKGVELKHFNDPQAFIKNSHDMDDINENIEESNLNKGRKILNLFHSMIVDMLGNKNDNPVVTSLFIRGRN